MMHDEEHRRKISEATTAAMKRFHAERCVRLDVLIEAMSTMTQQEQALTIGALISSKEKQEWGPIIVLCIRALEAIYSKEDHVKLSRLLIRMSNILRDSNLSDHGKVFQLRQVLEHVLSSIAPAEAKRISKMSASPQKALSEGDADVVSASRASPPTSFEQRISEIIAEVSGEPSASVER